MASPTQASRGIAAVVSDALSAAGIAQRDAADKTGIPLTTLSRRLTGHSPFLVTELALLADLLDTPMAELVARAEDVAA